MRPNPFVNNPPKTEAELEERLHKAIESLPQPTERDLALQAQARGEVYAPPGKCGECNQ
jgi:hypothetical protein